MQGQQLFSNEIYTADKSRLQLTQNNNVENIVEDNLVIIDDSINVQKALNKDKRIEAFTENRVSISNNFQNNGSNFYKVTEDIDDVQIGSNAQVRTNTQSNTNSSMKMFLNNINSQQAV